MQNLKRICSIALIMVYLDVVIICSTVFIYSVITLYLYHHLNLNPISYTVNFKTGSVFLNLECFHGSWVQNIVFMLK